jgi:hypothetical protein
VPPIPDDDPIALTLRDHFDTEASDAGLRSIDLSGSGVRVSSSPDAGAVARASRNRQEEHRRVREALRRLDRRHADALSLAYGTRLRDRDMDDGRRGKAPKRSERDWRVLLHELYPIGPCVAVVLIAPTAEAMAREHGDGNVRTWLLSSISESHRETVRTEAVELLKEARAAFAAAFVPPPGRPRLDAAPRQRRGRPFDKERIRYQALDGAHNEEIFRR